MVRQGMDARRDGAEGDSGIALQLGVMLRSVADHQSKVTSVLDRGHSLRRDWNLGQVRLGDQAT
jgi:hypothetical protein